MRPLKLRFSLGTLILLVLLIALNLAVFRHLIPPDGWTLGFVMGMLRHSDSITSMALIGLLPLFDVTCFGMAWWIRRAYHTQRRCLLDKNISQPLMGYPIFVFSCVHFLGLALISTDLKNNVCVSVEKEICVISENVRNWINVSTEASKFLMRFSVCECAISVMIVSGPPLLISALAQWLASRSLPRLSRVRRRVLLGTMSFGFALAAVSMAFSLRKVDELRHWKVDVELVDQVTRKPIPSALVRVREINNFDTNDGLDASGISDSKGHVRLNLWLWAQGESNLFGYYGDVCADQSWVEISAEGYGNQHIPLADVVDPIANAAHDLHGQIVLNSRNASGDNFQRMQGFYRSVDTLNYCLKIEADGRFSTALLDNNADPYRHYLRPKWFYALNYMTGHVEIVGDRLYLKLLPRLDPKIWNDISLSYWVVHVDGEPLLLPIQDETIDLVGQAKLNPEDEEPRSRLVDYLFYRSTSTLPLSFDLPRLPPDFWFRYFKNRARDWLDQFAAPDPKKSELLSPPVPRGSFELDSRPGP